MEQGFLFKNVFNLYDSLLLMTAGLALVLAIPVLLKRDRKASDLLLAIFVLCQGLYSFYNVMLYTPFVVAQTLELCYPLQTTPRLLITG